MLVRSSSSLNTALGDGGRGNGVKRECRKRCLLGGGLAGWGWVGLE